MLAFQNYRNPGKYKRIMLTITNIETMMIPTPAAFLVFS
jgi:hypothetical protein